MQREIINSLAIIIPCFKAGKLINTVVERLKDLGIQNIIVVNDKCPEDSYKYIKDSSIDIVDLENNHGVGGAFIEGFNFISNNPRFSNISYIAKIDADDQHDPEDILLMLDDLIQKDADLIKGNRYLLSREPVGQSFIRKFGNFGLTFLHKLSTGYWHTADPINGMIVVRKEVLSLILLKFEIHSRYLFESSILSSCSKVGAVVFDCPNTIKYDGEHSSLSVKSEILRFGIYYLKNFSL